jgi:hypothetical protein
MVGEQHVLCKFRLSVAQQRAAEIVSTTTELHRSRSRYRRNSVRTHTHRTMGAINNLLTIFEIG